MFRPLYHHPLHRWLGEPQSLPGSYGAEKIRCLPPEINPRVPGRATTRYHDPEDQGMNHISMTEQTVKKHFLEVRHEKRGKLISDSLWDSEEQACRSLRQRVIDTQTSGYGTPVALLRVRRRQSLRVVHSQRPNHVRFEVFRAACMNITYF